jgi:hypothetical protein
MQRMNSLSLSTVMRAVAHTSAVSKLAVVALIAVSIFVSAARPLARLSPTFRGEGDR